jgi:hypothetical protein
VRTKARDPGGRDEQRDGPRQQTASGVDRREAERDRQEQRDDEKTPDWMKYWKKNISSPR